MHNGQNFTNEKECLGVEKSWRLKSGGIYHPSPPRSHILRLVSAKLEASWETYTIRFLDASSYNYYHIVVSGHSPATSRNTTHMSHMTQGLGVASPLVHLITVRPLWCEYYLPSWPVLWPIWVSSQHQFCPSVKFVFIPEPGLYWVLPSLHIPGPGPGLWKNTGFWAEPGMGARSGPT